MCEAVGIVSRYDTLRDFGQPYPETRRDYNIRFGWHPGPEADVPETVSHVWDWFWKLNSRRSTDQGQGVPLTWSEIDAWLRLSDTEALPQEIEMIFAMDNALLSANATERREMQNKSDKPQAKKRYPA